MVSQVYDKISQLPTQLHAVDGTELMEMVQNGVSVKVPTSGLLIDSASFIMTVNQSSVFPQSRTFVAGANITITDGGPGGPFTISATGGGAVNSFGNNWNWTTDPNNLNFLSPILNLNYFHVSDDGTNVVISLSAGNISTTGANIRIVDTGWQLWAPGTVDQNRYAFFASSDGEFSISLVDDSGIIGDTVFDVTRIGSFSNGLTLSAAQCAMSMSAGGFMLMNSSHDITMLSSLGDVSLNGVNGKVNLILGKELSVNGVSGTAGQVLTSQGVGLPPHWAAGGGSSLFLANGYCNGATGGIINSNRVISVSKTGTGQYNVILTDNFANTPSVAPSVTDGPVSGWTYVVSSQTTGPGTSGFVLNYYKNGVATNPAAFSFLVMGN